MRGENGFGFTLRGDSPVLIAGVIPGGCAAVSTPGPRWPPEDAGSGGSRVASSSIGLFLCLNAQLYDLITPLVCSGRDSSLPDLSPGLTDGCHERIVFGFGFFFFRRQLREKYGG